MASSERLRVVVSILAGILVLGLGLWLMIYAPGQIRNVPYKEIVRSLGAFLAASVLVEFLYNITIRPYDDAKLMSRLSSLMQHEFQRITQTEGYGLVGIRERLDCAKMLAELPSDATLWWLDTYDPGYKIWLDSMRDAIKRGVAFKMLVMSPESAMLEHRARELGEHYQPNVFRRELIGFLEDMRALEKKFPDHVQVVEYVDLPSAPIYVLTREERGVFGRRHVPFRAYSSYFLSEPTGAGFPHLIWRRDRNSFTDELFKYIVEKWERNLQAQQM